MLSSSIQIQIQPQPISFLKSLTFTSENFKNLHNPSAVFTSSLPTASKPSSFSGSIYALPLGPRLKKLDLKSSATSTGADPFLTDGDDLPPNHQKELGVVVKPLEKPRLVLKFIWMQKDIGIALNQVIPGHGTIPLSPYYFWPRKDAWEELRVLLDSKPWISQLHRVHLLNQATDIINLWQASGAHL